MENGNIISHGTLAKMCNILPINAGRIVSGLKKNINTSYVTEKREGPPNHFLNNLELKNEKGVIERSVDMNVKTVYRSLNNNQYKKPAVDQHWINYFHNYYRPRCQHLGKRTVSPYGSRRERFVVQTQA